MLTAIVVFVSVAFVLVAGEAVRSQCRRMLGRPLVTMPAGAAEALGSEVGAA